MALEEQSWGCWGHSPCLAVPVCPPGAAWGELSPNPTPQQGAGAASSCSPSAALWHRGRVSPWVPGTFPAFALQSAAKLIIPKSAFYPNLFLISWDLRKSEDQWKVLPLLSFQICFGM